MFNPFALNVCREMLGYKFEIDNDCSLFILKISAS
jgi:hypothetical protein